MNASGTVAEAWHLLWYGVRRLPCESHVLRLTPTRNGSTRPLLKAEGRLVGEWADLLESECAALVGATGALDLDLGGLIDVDARGLEVLRRLQRGPVALVGCTPILLALLAQESLP